jgi:hypothetical protein
MELMSENIALCNLHLARKKCNKSKLGQDASFLQEQNPTALLQYFPNELLVYTTIEKMFNVTAISAIWRVYPHENDTNFNER